MDLSVYTESFQQDDQSWLASAHGTDTARSITLDVSAFTKADHYPNGYIKSGIALAKLNSGGKYVPFAHGSATDGSAKCVGFLLDAVKAPAVNTVDVQGALLWHGAVYTSKTTNGADFVAADVPSTIATF